MTYDATRGTVTGYQLRTVAVDMPTGPGGAAPGAAEDEDWSGADEYGWAGSGGGFGTGDADPGFPWILAILAGVVVVAYAVGGSDE